MPSSVGSEITMASSVVALASASMDDTAPVASREDVTRLSLTNVHASERLMVIRERKSPTTPKIVFQVSQKNG